MGSIDKDNAASAGTDSFLSKNDPVVNEAFRSILTQYSGIAEAQVTSHVKTIRNKAWAVRPYPCIGNYFFLDLSITEHPRYQDVLTRITSRGATLLDIGCCFGQDLRKLVFDGAPSSSLRGCDLLSEFIDLGYELFQDRETFAAKFSATDFFAQDLNGLSEASLDLIFAADFFHCFDWDEQVQAMARAVRLLRPCAGSMLFGRQVGMEQAQDFAHVASRTGSMYRHNEQSFRRMVDEVAAQTGYSLGVETQSQRHQSWGDDEFPGMLLLSFSIMVSAPLGSQ